MPYFEDCFEDNQDVDLFLAYVESTWIGKKRTRGNRSAPRFPINMWNRHLAIKEDRPTTNNAVESFNGRWNQSIGTKCNVWEVISKFKTEDSLTRDKVREMVTGKRRDSNPGRKEQRAIKMEQLKKAVASYDNFYMKEYMFGMRDHV